MSVPSPETRVVEIDADCFGRTFWSRRTMVFLMISALALWSVPIAIGYELVRLL